MGASQKEKDEVAFIMYGSEQYKEYDQNYRSECLALDRLPFMAACKVKKKEISQLKLDLIWCLNELENEHHLQPIIDEIRKRHEI